MIEGERAGVTAGTEIGKLGFVHSALIYQSQHEHLDVVTRFVRDGLDVDEAVLLSDRIVMMTNGPAATIGEICEVRLDRPRPRLALAEDPEYIRCRSAVMRFLYERQRHPKAA